MSIQKCYPSILFWVVTGLSPYWSNFPRLLRGLWDYLSSQTRESFHRSCDLRFKAPKTHCLDRWKIRPVVCIKERRRNQFWAAFRGEFHIRYLSSIWWRTINQSERSSSISSQPFAHNFPADNRLSLALRWAQIRQYLLGLSTLELAWTVRRLSKQQEGPFW